MPAGTVVDEPSTENITIFGPACAAVRNDSTAARTKAAAERECPKNDPRVSRARIGSSTSGFAWSGYPLLGEPQRMAINGAAAFAAGPAQIETISKAKSAGESRDRRPRRVSFPTDAPHRAQVALCQISSGSE